MQHQQQPLPPDLAWAADVLGGAETLGPWRSPQTNRGAGSASQARRQAPPSTQQPGAGAPASGGGRQQAGRRRKQGQQQQQQQPQKRKQQLNQQQQQHQQQTSGTSSDSSDDGRGGNEGEGAALAAYGRPGPRSTARAQHCAACDCWVPKRPGDWEVHVAGIRHRRQLLSIRVHGEPNRLVLSAFESLPDAGDAAQAQRLVGKAARDFGLSPAGSSGAAGGLPPAALKAARALYSEAQQQLLAFADRQAASKAARFFEEQRLAGVLQAAEQRLLQQQQQQQQQQPATWDAADGAGLAAAAHLARSGRLCCTQLLVRLLPTEALSRWMHASLAAGLLLLVPALQRCGGLAALHLQLPGVPAAAGADVTAHVHLSSLWEVAWQRALGQLRDLLASGQVPLRSLHLTLPPVLAAATAAYQPQLEAAAAAGPRAIRATLLLGLHPRAGRCSLLSLLPLEVMAQVLDRAAPLQPCAITAGVQPAG